MILPANILRAANTGLLLVIAITLILILRSIPQPLPSEADLAAAIRLKNSALVKSLRSRIPKVTVKGEVGILSDSAEGYRPIQIESFPPIEVSLTDIQLGPRSQPLPVTLREPEPPRKSATVTPGTVQTPEQLRIQRRSDFLNAVEESKVEAVRLYPDAAIPDSALSRKMGEIEDRLKAEKNPILHSANAPLLITEMAAKELSIEPRR